MPDYTQTTVNSGAVTVTIGGQAVYFENFSLDVSSESVSITTNGHFDAATGLTEKRKRVVSVTRKFTATAVVDDGNDVLGIWLADNPDTPMELSPFAAVMPDYKTFTCPHAVLDNFKLDAKVPGLVMYSVSGETQGAMVVT